MKLPRHSIFPIVLRGTELETEFFQEQLHFPGVYVCVIRRIFGQLGRARADRISEKTV